MRNHHSNSICCLLQIHKDPFFSTRRETIKIYNIVFFLFRFNLTVRESPHTSASVEVCAVCFFMAVIWSAGAGVWACQELSLRVWLTSGFVNFQKCNLFIWCALFCISVLHHPFLLRGVFHSREEGATWHHRKLIWQHSVKVLTEQRGGFMLRVFKKVDFIIQSHTYIFKASACLCSYGLTRVAHVWHWRQKGLGCQVLSAFSGLLAISGDRFDFIQVFYAFKIQQLCWHGSFASGYFLLQPPQIFCVCMPSCWISSDCSMTSCCACRIKGGTGDVLCCDKDCCFQGAGSWS